MVISVESVCILWCILYVIMDVCFILSLSDEQLKNYYQQSERKSRQSKQKGPKKCLVEGWGRVGVKLWNHLQKYLVKHGLTGELILRNLCSWSCIMYMHSQLIVHMAY